uniref:Transposase n=1 Tax=Heligmosomoides polygyrus TaxID=6339 RepID=A0A183FEI5_HELPZ
LWTNEVKEKVRKKRLYHAFLDDKTADKWRLYQEAKKPAKKAVAVARATHYDDKITVEEALKKMKPGKATGPDDLAADLWKSKSWYPAKWLATFFNQVIAEKKVPDIWQRSTTIPI